MLVLAQSLPLPLPQAQAQAQAQAQVQVQTRVLRPPCQHSCRKARDARGLAGPLVRAARPPACLGRDSRLCQNGASCRFACTFLLHVQNVFYSEELYLAARGLQFVTLNALLSSRRTPARTAL